jgi:hypothetical protein
LLPPTNADFASNEGSRGRLELFEFITRLDVSDKYINANFVLRPSRHQIAALVAKSFSGRVQPAVASMLEFRVRSRASLEFELFALRHQVTVLLRQRPGRPRFYP